MKAINPWINFNGNAEEASIFKNQFLVENLEKLSALGT